MSLRLSDRELKEILLPVFKKLAGLEYHAIKVYEWAGKDGMDRRETIKTFIATDKILAVAAQFGITSEDLTLTTTTERKENQ